MDWEYKRMIPPTFVQRLLACLLMLVAVAAVVPATSFAQEVQEDTASVQDVPPGVPEEAQEFTETEIHDEEHHTPVPPIWLVAPFVILLLMIATGPLFYAHHWHHHYPKYAVGLGAFVTLYYVFVMDAPIAMLHALQEYLSFIALVASLFIAASGIFLRVNARGTPLVNTALLAIGSVIANLIATTGAAMLFIRPYMRLNQGRLKPYHIVFFIFVVANVGGALTPIGDPPLFLGFLRGVPFFWTFTHVFHVWLPTMVVILGIFFILDLRNKEKSPEKVAGEPTVSIIGWRSFLFVLVIILSVFIDPNVFDWVPAFHIGDVHLPFGIREIIMFTMCYVGYKFCKQEALEKNQFSFEPIREVGWLFLGIFACMVPALNLIAAFASANADTLGVSTFYWGTGALSGFLDNAPTYLNFLAAAMGKFGLDVGVPAEVTTFAQTTAPLYLQAISVAAVFFGAMSYIGNAPNFMVKAIAESNNVDAPSFAGYLFKYAIPILLPIYFVVWLVFYSGWVF